jgi:hypothetical protein
MPSPPTDDTVRSPNYRDLLVAQADRPRSTRPTARGTMDFSLSVIFAGGCAATLAWRLYVKCAASRSFSVFQSADWFRLAAVVVILMFVLPFIVRMRRRDRNLVKNGNIAIASVINQRMHSRSGSWITYTFSDARGSQCQGACTDRTKELFKGMSFVVFYEPELPTRRIGSCESSFEVVLPNEEWG